MKCKVYLFRVLFYPPTDSLKTGILRNTLWKTVSYNIKNELMNEKRREGADIDTEGRRNGVYGGK